VEWIEAHGATVGMIVAILAGWVRFETILARLQNDVLWLKDNPCLHCKLDRVPTWQQDGD